MKKILTLALAVLTTGSALALDNEPKQGFTYMGFLGMTTSQIRNTAYDGKVGGTAGMRLDYVLPKAHGTYLSAGVDWSMRGGKYDVIALEPTSLATSEATEFANLHYVEIPIHVGFRYNFSNEVGVYGEVGPYFAVGVGGKKKLSVDADGPQWRTLEDANTWGAFKKNKTVGHTNFQRWDAGLGFRVGAEYNKHYNLMLGCDWGFTDMYRDDYRDAVAVAADAYAAAVAAATGGTPITVPEVHKLSKAKNFNFALTFGYRF